MKPTVLLLAVLVFSGFIFSEDISGCRNITSSGSYTLVSDLQGANMSNAPYNYCFRITTSNVELDCAGHSITNNGTTQSSGIYAGSIWLGGSEKNITIKNCIISSYTNEGIYMNGYNSGALLNNTISNISGSLNEGFYFTNSGNNLVSNNTAKDCGIGFLFSNANSKNNTLFNNTASNCSNYAFAFQFGAKNNTLFKNLAYGSNYGFFFESTSWNNISANRAYNITYSGFRIIGSDMFGHSENNLLEHNIAGNASYPAFSIEYSSDYTTLVNNTAYFSGSCFYIYQSSRATLTGNTAHSCTSGFYLHEDSSIARFHLLEGNKAYNNTRGFYVFRSSSNTLTDNRAYNNSNGFYVDNTASSNNLSGNVACNNTIHGFYIATPNNLLWDNTACNNTDSGFYIYNSPASGNTLTNNTAYENTYGFKAYWTSDSSNTLINNTFYNNTNSQLMLEGSRYYIITGTRMPDGSATSLGYRIVNARNEEITGGSISNLGTAFFFSNGDSNNIANITLSGISAAQINGTSGSSGNDFINITGLDSSKFFASGGSNFFIGWYALAYVNDTAGNPVNGASVVVRNNYSTQEWSDATDAAGLTNWHISYEKYYADGSPAVALNDYNDHSAAASLGAASDLVSANILNNIQINLTLDLTLPCVTIEFPTSDTEYATSTIDLNYTVSDNLAIDSCWYTDPSGANQTLPGCANSTVDFPGNGNYNITVYANDTSGNIGNASAMNITINVPAPPSSKGGKDEGPLFLSKEFECAPGTIYFHTYVGTKDISGATLKLFLKEGTWLKKVAENTTDKNGEATILVSASGYYEATVSKEGYESKTIRFTIEECPEETLPQEALPGEEPAEPPPTGCTSSSDCSTTQECVQGECTEITGACGYAQNHAWVEYECCSGSDCGANENCENHECIASTFTLSIPALVVGEPARIVAYKDGSPEPGAAVEVTFPDGTREILTTDSSGAIEFTPEEEGEYSIQVLDDSGEPLAGKASIAQAPAPVSAPIGPETPILPEKECCLLGVCSSVIGICWYWWLLGLIVLAGGAAVLTGAITLGAGKPKA